MKDAISKIEEKETSLEKLMRELNVPVRRIKSAVWSPYRFYRLSEEEKNLIYSANSNVRLQTL